MKEKVPNDVLVLPAHGEPFFGLHERLDHLYQSQVESLCKLHEALTQPHRVVDLFRTIFKKEIGTDPMQQWLATGETRALLNYLLESGEVAVDLDKAGVIWFRSS